MNGIPETRTLYDILPAKSAASGKEFARIVNLLLFHDARSRGENLTLFDDRAGDFCGLDAFRQGASGIIAGYQHKFYPTPLSDAHRAEIEASLLKTRDQLKKKKIDLKKWVLVTPQDLVEAPTRKTGGDVTWFSGLRNKHKITFELEHWGHNQLQSLFLQTPAIGLYYYPALFQDGAARRKTIQQQRTQYDQALNNEYGRIEFVGMAVYKQETARTVPMENIFIPLSIVSEDADEESRSVIRRDPQELLAAGERHVILGDPGSGKTTLLRFLALVGRSEALQKRYGRRPDAVFAYREDERLPILVTLRRYADALKKDDNLALFDYIRANIAADFSIADLAPEFLEYHLESGRAILLFDGLDELPNPEFKRKVRNRVQNLGDAYPGNTILVTSRIYGYQELRFDNKAWRHHRVAKLNMAEIERFVHDWYQVRMERPKERMDNMESLLAILRNEEHGAIRELARNPLLLTIIVLVHRIDAVLPDERHVLYQKCTETLLNTWHTSKFHEKDRLHLAKVDRLNMQRMQAVAWWMQQRMGATDATRQAVASYEDLHEELSRHIAQERPPNRDYAPEDLATDFIEFVQDRAGLLVEIGDRQFSFVHLTFQEYLTAGHIKTMTEPLSLQDAWNNEIAPHCADPRWREVIRLLVASYGANRSQELLLEWMLALPPAPQISLLLAGLYLDGVAAAQMALEQIFGRLLETTASTKGASLLADQLRQLRACHARDGVAGTSLENAARSLSRRIRGDTGKTKLRLVLVACGLPPQSVWNLCGAGAVREQAIITLFFGESLSPTLRDVLADDFELLQTVNYFVLLNDPFGSFFSPLGWSLLDRAAYPHDRRLFITLLAIHVHSHSQNGGPLPFLISYCSVFSPFLELRRYGSLMARNRGSDLSRPGARALALALARALALVQDRDQSRALARDRVLNLDINWGRQPPWEKLEQAITSTPSPLSLSELRERLWSEPQNLTAVAKYFTDVFALKPDTLWQEALKASRLRELPGSLPLVNPAKWRAISQVFTSGTADQQAVWQAASQLILDGALFIFGFFEPDGVRLRKMGYTDEDFAAHRTAAAEAQTLLAELAKQTRAHPALALRIAHCIRDLAYGNGSRIYDLKAMVKSTDLEFHQIFVDCY